MKNINSEKIKDIKLGAYYQYTTKSSPSNCHIIRPIEITYNSVYFYFPLTGTIIHLSHEDVVKQCRLYKEAKTEDLKQLHKLVNKEYKNRYNLCFRGTLGLDDKKDLKIKSIFSSSGGNKEEKKIIKENIKLLKEANQQMLVRYKDTKMAMLKSNIKEEKHTLKRALKTIALERKDIRFKIKAARAALK